jgi:hypothetical protein
VPSKSAGTLGRGLMPPKAPLSAFEPSIKDVYDLVTAQSKAREAFERKTSASLKARDNFLLELLEENSKSQARALTALSEEVESLNSLVYELCETAKPQPAHPREPARVDNLAFKVVNFDAAAFPNTEKAKDSLLKGLALSLELTKEAFADLTAVVVVQKMNPGPPQFIFEFRSPAEFDKLFPLIKKINFTGEKWASVAANSSTITIVPRTSWVRSKDMARFKDARGYPAAPAHPEMHQDFH